MKFKGRVALVTGASRGIGQATALKLASEGATVAVHYSRAAAKAEAVCEQIRNLGQKAIPIQADIADRDAVNRMVATVTEELGTIELLVNNAGDVGDVAFDELAPEHWDRIIAINLTGPFNVLWAVKPGMIEKQFGRIVNVSSIAALAVPSEPIALCGSESRRHCLDEIVLWTACTAQHPHQFGCPRGNCDRYVRGSLNRDGGTTSVYDTARQAR